MSTSAAKQVRPAKAAADARIRHRLAAVILERQKKIAPDLLVIDEAKDELRSLCEEAGESFTEEVKGLGVVEVTKGSTPKLKGILPVFDPETFIALPQSRREKLIEQKIGITMEPQYTKATKPSVTVRM